MASNLAIVAHLGTDNTAFNRGLAQAEEKAKRTTAAISQYQLGISKRMAGFTFGGVGAMAGGILSVGGLSMLSQHVLKLTGSFEQLRISFRVLIGDAAKAQNLLQQVVRFADITPFETEEVAAAAKQLLAYRVEVSEIIPWLTRLGNIASGLNVPLSELVDVFGRNQAQTKVMTKDLREFMTRGVPVLDELAKRFGVTRDVVMDMASKGKIGINDLNAALKNLSEGGGQFAGMMDEQSKSMLGVWSTLKGTINSALREIGDPIATKVVPALKGMNEWVETNKGAFKALGEIAAASGGLAAKAFEWGSGAAKAIPNMLPMFPGGGAIVGQLQHSQGAKNAWDKLQGIGRFQPMAKSSPYTDWALKIYNDRDAFERQMSADEADAMRRSMPAASGGPLTRGPGAPTEDQQKFIARWIDVNNKNRLIGLEDEAKATEEIRIARENIARADQMFADGRLTAEERALEVAAMEGEIKKAQHDMAKDAAKAREDAAKYAHEVEMELIDAETEVIEEYEKRQAKIAEIAQDAQEAWEQAAWSRATSSDRVLMAEEKIRQLRAAASREDDDVRRAEKVKEIYQWEIAASEARRQAALEEDASHARIMSRIDTKEKRNENKNERKARLAALRAALPSEIPAAHPIFGYGSDPNRMALAASGRGNDVLANLQLMRQLDRPMGFYERANRDRMIQSWAHDQMSSAAGVGAARRDQAAMLDKMERMAKSGQTAAEIMQNLLDEQRRGVLMRLG